MPCATPEPEPEPEPEPKPNPNPNPNPHPNPKHRYETGHTRAFYHGRTDTVRTCSLASCAFVRTMEEAGATAADKWSALKAACDSHGEQLQRVL